MSESRLGGHRFNEKELRLQLERSKALSLDIFDTALWRHTLAPTDIFTEVEVAGIAAGLPVSGFAEKRVLAEQHAREKRWTSDGQWEVNFEEIYTQLGEDQPDWASWAEELKRRELEAESRALRPNPFILQLACDYLASGRPVIAVSDMYHSRAVLERFLKDAGYPASIPVLVSSQYRCSKASGELFPFALATLSLDAKEVLHLGDNVQSDIGQALAAGFQTHYIPKPATFADRSLQAHWDASELGENPGGRKAEALRCNARCLRQLQGDRAADGLGARLGYEVFGPFLAGFVGWLGKRVLDQGAGRVYFLARDGWLLQRFYDRMAAVEGLDYPRSIYLPVSRRAVAFPTIQVLDEEAIRFLHTGVHRISVGAFLRRIGLTPDECLEAIQSAGFTSIDSIVDSAEEYAALHRVFYALEPVILERAAHEREALQAYMTQEGFADIAEAAIVDVGWQGTIQHNLRKLLPDKVSLHGYYIGSFGEAHTRSRVGSQICGYVVENGWPEADMQWLHWGLELLECFLTTSEPSALRYEMTPEGPRVKYDHSTHPESSLARIKELQAGAVRFCEDYWNDGASPGTIPRSEALIGLRQLVASPTGEEAEFLGELEHAEGYGDQYHWKPLARPLSFFQGLIGPNLLRKDFKSCSWRPAYKMRLSRRQRLLFRIFSPDKYRKWMA